MNNENLNQLVSYKNIDSKFINKLQSFTTEATRLVERLNAEFNENGIEATIKNNPELISEFKKVHSELKFIQDDIKIRRVESPKKQNETDEK